MKYFFINDPKIKFLSFPKAEGGVLLSIRKLFPVKNACPCSGINMVCTVLNAPFLKVG